MDDFMRIRTYRMIEKRKAEKAKRKRLIKAIRNILIFIAGVIAGAIIF